MQRVRIDRNTASYCIQQPYSKESRVDWAGISGVAVWIVDSEGRPVGLGEDGGICCSGPTLTKGYHNNPVATDEVATLAPNDKSRLFHTCNLVRLEATDIFSSLVGSRNCASLRMASTPARH